MKVADHINLYLEAKEPVWSLSTYKSERARLTKYKDILELPALEVFRSLKDFHDCAPYTIKTLFIRFSNYMQWCIDGGYMADNSNKFKAFLQNNKQVFRFSYKTEVLTITFNEAFAKIKEISAPSVRYHANYLLRTGLRLHESYKLRKLNNGIIEVKGKGGKYRRVFIDHLPEYLVPMSTLQRALKEVGLKPHSLRKLFATRLLTEGELQPHELCRVMGWSHIQTALSYLQSRSEVALNDRIQELI